MENLAFFMVERGFGMNLIRNIFGMLDSVAFFLFAKVMEVMFEIADVTSKANLSEFLGPLQSRIYVILSIYMLFKVTISLITYVVNPDAMTDKSQGIGKLVQRIVISLILLIFFPYAFSFLNTFQSHIISNNTIPKLVLGSGGSYSDAAGIGNEIAYSVYNGTFIYAGDPGSKVESDSATVESVIEHINDPGSDKSEYANGYLPFAGFAVGLVLTILTLSMCVDVAMRVFKLMILQLVAPIPILSYIDPKSSKDGAFSKWLKMTVQVWLEVFLRLFTIYFILLVIERLINAGGLLFDGNNLFVKIALIIGLLFFAKDAPKFIYDALGIKAPERGMFAGMGNILAAGAIGLGAVGTGIAVGRAQRGSGWHFGNAAKALFSGTGAAIGAGATGIYAAGTAKDHNAKAALEARNKYMNNVLNGNTFGARASAGAQNLILGYDIDREIAHADSIVSATKQVRDYTMSEGAKFFSDEKQKLSFVDSSGKSHSVNYSLNEIEAAKQHAAVTGGPVRLQDSTGATVELSNSAVNKIYGDAQEGTGNMLMDVLSNKSDSDTVAMRERYKDSFGDEAKYIEKSSQQKEVVDSYFVNVANATGDKNASSMRIGQLKGIQKEAERKVFNLKQKKGK